MTKTVTNIKCPKNWESEDDYSSHRPALWLAISKMDVKDSIYEFGCGFGSSPLIASMNLWFNSYETNKEWSDKFVHTVYVDSYFDIPFPSFGKYTNEVGVLFVDAAPGEIRKELIDKWANEAKVIVVHDSEKSSQFCYDLEPTLSKFEYRLDYEPVGKPHTTIISNKINVCEWI